MAGDWIKMRSNIGMDPDVIVMAGALGKDEFSVVGRLHAVWSWLDQHSKDGTNVRITSAFLDRLTACSGFADAMRAVGWLNGRDGALTFPNWDRHNGDSAKLRASETKRKAILREEKTNRDICPGPGGTFVPEKPGPEKRREESTDTHSLAGREGSESGSDPPDTGPIPKTGFPTKAQVAEYCRLEGWPLDAGLAFWLHFDERRSKGEPISANWHWWSRLEKWVMDDHRNGKSKNGKTGNTDRGRQARVDRNAGTANDASEYAEIRNHNCGNP